MFIIILNNPFGLPFHRIINNKEELNETIKEYQYRIIKIYKIEKEILPEFKID
jgi:hypothetical protein